MSWMSTALKTALKGNHSIGYFFRLGTSPVGRLWTGARDIVAGFDGIDPAGSVYRGSGLLTTLPDIELLVNGISADVDFRISGVETELSELLEPDMPDVTGCDILIGLNALTPRFEVLGSILPLAKGKANSVQLEQPRVKSATETPTRTYVLNCTFGETARSRSAVMTYTSASQRSISADDAFCDRVARYSQGNNVTWPHF